MDANDTARFTDCTAFLTGHRHIPLPERDDLRLRLRKALSDACERGYRKFYCGAAIGFDTIAANEVIRLKPSFPGLSLLLAVPCADQSARWSEEDRSARRRIMSSADDVIVLSPFYYQGCMMVRNRYMADRSSLCICYLTHWHGGTAATVRYAVQRQMDIVNLASVPALSDNKLREPTWKYMCISPFAGKSAVTVRLRLLPAGKLKRKRI